MTTNCREFNGYVEFRVSGIVVEMVLWNLIEMVFIVSGVVVGICQRGEIRGIVLKFNGYDKGRVLGRPPDRAGRAGAGIYIYIYIIYIYICIYVCTHYMYVIHVRIYIYIYIYT